MWRNTYIYHADTGEGGDSGGKISFIWAEASCIVHILKYINPIT